MEFGDNLMPLWVNVIIIVITLILIIFFNVPGEILPAVVGILIGLDALYYLFKWIRKIDF